MSAFAKVQKVKQRPHRERSQLGSRQRLGLLEKKKDYKERADNYHRKRDQITKMRKLAYFKNPDEFYHNMASSKVKGGRHVFPLDQADVTETQKKLLLTQDISYVTMMRVQEGKKIDKLKDDLNLALALPQSNTRTVFVDDNSEKSLVLNHMRNRAEAKPGVTKATQKRYRELSRRIDREKELFVVEQKMQCMNNAGRDAAKAKAKLVTNTTGIYKCIMKRKK